MSVILCRTGAYILSNLGQEHTILLLFCLDVVRWTLSELRTCHVSFSNVEIVRYGRCHGTGRSDQWALGVAPLSTLSLFHEFPMASCSVVSSTDSVVVIILDGGPSLKRSTARCVLELSHSSLNWARTIVHSIHLIRVWSPWSHSETASSWTRSTLFNYLSVDRVELVVWAWMSSCSRHRLLPRVFLWVYNFVNL